MAESNAAVATSAAAGVVSATAASPSKPAAEKVLRMMLNGNTLRFKTGKGWILDSSDLDLATLEIENLLDEKDTLSATLKDAYDQIEELHKEVVQTNEAKSVVLEMVTLHRLYVGECAFSTSSEPRRMPALTRFFSYIVPSP